MTDLSGHVLILTGTPGAGKSTTARQLVDKSDTPAVHLHCDDFWHFIGKGHIPPYLPEAHQQNQVVLKVLTRATEEYARGGYFVVVDGIVGPWFLDPFRTISQPLHYVVLRPALAAAIERCRQRGGDTLSDPGPIGALHRQFAELGPLEKHVIETGDQSADRTLEAVLAALAHGQYRLQSTG